jgi:hypothetical protein
MHNREEVRAYPMTVSFTRTSVDDLVFHVYHRSVHPELLQICAESELWLDGWSAVVRICEAGHAVSFQRGEAIVTEVLTARDQPLPQRKRVLERKVRGSRDESLRFDHGLTYQASCQIEQLEPEVFQNLHEELLLDCRRADLSFRFPPGNRLAPMPISLIRTDATNRGLLVHAFHTFPDRCAVVKTQSLFEF